MKKVFFTGANGFVGSHLIPYLKQNINDIYIYEYPGKIESHEELKEHFCKEAWDYVFHFAGISHVMDCESSPQRAYEVNFLGTVLVAQIAREFGFSGKFFFTSTALNYYSEPGLKNIVFDESSRVLPQNVYGWTKYLSEKNLMAFTEGSKFQVVILRLFNHTHKTQSRKFFLPSVYGQILEAKDGDVITVGNIDIIRDFSLITDFCNKLLELMSVPQASRFEIVTLSSGVGRNLRTIIDKLILKSGKKLSVKTDNRLVRPNEPDIAIGNFKTSYSVKLDDDQFIEAFVR